MSGTSHLIHLWHIPSTKLLLRSSNFSKGFSLFISLFCLGSYLVPAAEIYPTKIFWCMSINIQESFSLSLSLHFQCDQSTLALFIPQCNSLTSAIIGDLQDVPPNNIASTTLETVGAFQKLPMVMPSVDILYSALRKAKRVSPTKGIANIAKRERNRAAKQLDFLMKELAVPLRGYAENFPDKKQLHPYEQSLIQLTLGDGNYEQVLRRVDSLRKKVVSVGKEHASLCAKKEAALKKVGFGDAKEREAILDPEKVEARRIAREEYHQWALLGQTSWSAREGHVLGFKVSGRGDEGVEVSHRCSLIVFFIFCEASQKQALCLSWIFLWFETISGLKINLDSP
ncbi:hypothetical protein CK203_090295 [Vitis vinifera]|uniref:NOG1 N-terminal helical domain-containing protein n=1 Tax=Vitis vinifera TaxID=29760 RepID=A0A438DSE2_VITVI|nr:hypothetical protein CK203_090295 [Vitis vinifera]